MLFSLPPFSPVDAIGFCGGTGNPIFPTNGISKNDLTCQADLIAARNSDFGASREVRLHNKKRGAAMSSICVLGTANVKSRSQEQSHGRSDSRTISLLAFLVAENRRLQNMVVELERDTTALREALQST